MVHILTFQLDKNIIENIVVTWIWWLDYLLCNYYK